MSTETIPDFIAQYGHHFQNNTQLTLALTAAGTERNNIEGNRLLAQVGDSILDAVLSLRAFERTQSRAELSFTRQLVLSAKQRAEVATRTGIAERIRYPPGCEGQPEKLRAAAVSAIIGAAFLQSGRDINQAGVLVDNLGLCMTSEQFATAQASANEIVNNNSAWDRGGPAQSLGTSVGFADWQALETPLQMASDHNSNVALSQAQSAGYVNGDNSSISFPYSGPSTVGMIAQMQPVNHYSENLGTAPTDSDDINRLLVDFRSDMTADIRRKASLSRTKDQALLRHLTEALSHSSMQNRFQELIVNYNSLDEAQRPAPQENLDVGQRFKRIGDLAGPSPVSQLLRAGHMLEIWNATSEDNFVDVNGAYSAADAPAGVSGNPISRATGAMADEQVRQILPDLDPPSGEFTDKRTEFLTIRRQGRNLRSFVNAFGVGVLGLIASLPAQRGNRNVIDCRLSQMSLQGIKQITEDLNNAMGGTVRRNSHTIEPYVLSMLRGTQFINYDLHTHAFE